ncbi:hypothetical protein D3C75_665570 [compost metagenome]
MGGFALHGNVDLGLERRRDGNAAYFPVGVDGITEVRLHPAGLHVAGTEQSGFLARRDDKTDGSVGNGILLQHADQLQHGGNACLVVAAQHCGAVAADDSILSQLGLNAFTRNHRIHVAGKINRRRAASVGAGRQCEAEIIALTARFGRGIVLLHLQAQSRKLLLQHLGDFRFMLGFTIHLDQSDKFLHQSLLVDHTRFPPDSFCVTIGRWASMSGTGPDALPISLSSFCLSALILSP